MRAKAGLGLLALCVGACLDVAEVQSPPDGGSCAGDCDGKPENGCEVDLETNPANCGACGNVCPGGANADPLCAASFCTLQCDAQFADCDGDPGNGCERAVGADPNNCGGCNEICGSANTVQSACQGGVCQLTCAPLFADCDAAPANGCEASLTANPSCGGCGRDCAKCDQGACAPELVAIDSNDAVVFALGAGVAYLGVEQSCTAPCTKPRDILRVSTDNGTETKLCDNPGAMRQLLLSANGALYWSGDGELKRLVLPATPSEVQAQLLLEDGDSPMEGMALDAQSVYFEEGGRVLRVGLAGGAMTTLVASGAWGRLALSEADVHFGGSIAGVDGIHVVPKTGGAPALFAPVTDLRSLAADPSHVYWAVTGKIQRRAVSAGTSEDFAAAQSTPERLFVDDTAVYWWDDSTAELRRKSKSGGWVEILTRSKTSTAVQTDATHVYWLESGRLYRVQR